MICTVSKKKDNAVLKGRLVDLEDRQRRDNLVFDGIPDGPKETSVDCERKAKKNIQDKLKVPNANKLVMGRVHRIGPYKPNQSKPRQTIVKFDLFKHRNKVWDAKKNLPRGSANSVKENFSKETERARAQLTPIMKVARKRGYYAKLDGQRLIVSSHDKGCHTRFS